MKGSDATKGCIGKRGATVRGLRQELSVRGVTLKPEPGSSQGHIVKEQEPTVPSGNKRNSSRT